ESPRAVAGSTVGHHTLQLDPMRGEEAAGVKEEGGCGAVSLVTVNLNEGQPTGVVDGHMDVLIPGPNRVPGPISVHGQLLGKKAVATSRRDPAELLDVDVN